MPISFRIFQFIVIHTVTGFGIINKAEIDVFLKLSCFFDDPANVGSLISGSSAFFFLVVQFFLFLVPLTFLKQLEHLEVHRLGIAQAWLGEF